MTIGERIAKCRKEKNLSQEYIADLLEVSRQAVSKWETDITEPDTKNLIQLAKVFGVSVEYLASGEEKVKIVYVEKNIPTLKIIGLIFLALGDLSLLFGIIMPYMLGVGIVTLAFGILLLLLKRDGLILSGIILALGVILFLIQGAFFGIDTPIMCLIAAISVGLPILIYSIIKLVKKIKADGAIKKIKENPALIKRIISVIVIAVFVITAITIPATIANRKRQNAFEKAKFFSSERLSTYMVEGLPAPSNVDCINISNEKLLLYFDANEWHSYLEKIYNFLSKKNFKHLGTKGELEGISEGTINYKFVKPNTNKHLSGHKHVEFSSNQNPDDYYFIYSNSELNETNGEIDCSIIHIKFIDNGEATINGKKFIYNAEMSIYGESATEGYKYPSFNINYATSDYDYLFLKNNPTQSIQGKQIKVQIRATKQNIDVCINGKAIERTFENSEYFEYTFIMPNHDVEIEINILEN